MPMMYNARAFVPNFASNAVAMKGESPPATTDASCDPIDAPLYRTLVPNSSEKNAACGAYIGACASRNEPTIAVQTSRVEPVSSSQNSGQANAPVMTAPKR